MLETNIQEKLNTPVASEIGTPSPEVPVFSSETNDRNTVQPMVKPVSPIQNENSIKQEASVTRSKLIGPVSVDSGISWKNVIDSKEQGVEPSEL